MGETGYWSLHNSALARGAGLGHHPDIEIARVYKASRAERSTLGPE